MVMVATGGVRTAPPNNTASFLGDPNGIIAYALSQTTAANGYLLRLGDLTAGLTPPAITPEFPTGGSAPALDVPDMPAVTYPVWTSPSIPAAFSGSLDVSDLTVDPFDASPPTIIYGASPDSFTEDAPGTPTITLDFDDPTLSLTLPAAPDLLSISVTPFSGLNMPVFSAADPTLTLIEPTIREYTPGADYTSSLLTGLQASLLARITDGGTGLNQDAENAIWDRGREREAKSYRDAIVSLDQMEALGYTLPPGVYFQARQNLAVERDAQDRGHSREVMVKSAELELDNVKHALSTATQIESNLLSYTNSVEQRMFESTKYATEAGIAIYNAKVEQYKTLVDVYRAKVQIYEAQVRAETARVDAYRATIEAERAKAEVNTALVQQYRIRADVALSAIEVYKAEIAGIQAKADIERTKIMVFGEQVKAYAAKINAYTAGVEGYRAQLEGEKTKALVYQAQVDAFSSQVTANARQVEARVSAFRGIIEAKTVEWDGYKAQSSAEASRVQSYASVTSSVAEIYRATVTGIASYNEVLTKQWQAALDQNQRVAEIGVSAAKANSELYVTTRSLALDAAKVGATVSAQLGAAALNAVNWSSSISNSSNYGISDGYSNGFSISASQSTNDSTSENHNYNYSV